MPNLELNGYSIDDITKGLGASAVAAYALGYIVLSYYLSSFGFSPLSPFRSRVLETGISAIVLFAIPISLGGTVASISRRDMSFVWILAMRILCLPFLCAIVCSLPGFIDELPRSIPVPQNHPLGKFILILAVASLFTSLGWLILRWLWHNYHKKKMAVILTLVLLSGLFSFVALNPSNTLMHRRIFEWLLAISIFACVVMGSSREQAAQKRIDKLVAEVENYDRDLDGILRELRGSSEQHLFDQRRSIDIEERTRRIKGHLSSILADVRSHTSLKRLEPFLNVFGTICAFAYLICAIGGYSNWVFPYIPFKLGGGEIVRVSLFETRPDQSARLVKGGMLDQTDQGFYILPLGSDKGMFIPKERISAIYFGSDLTKISE